MPCPRPREEGSADAGRFRVGFGRFRLGRPQHRAEPNGHQQDAEGDIDRGLQRVVGGEAGVANQDPNRADDDEDDRGASGQGRSTRNWPFSGQGVQLEQEDDRTDRRTQRQRDHLPQQAAHRSTEDMRGGNNMISPKQMLRWTDEDVLRHHLRRENGSVNQLGCQRPRLPRHAEPPSVVRIRSRPPR